ncbi:ATP-dependent DNA helicase [Salix suchowensis]|nr:ATP-dependent DNA helicase [Salix suchowensis]
MRLDAGEDEMEFGNWLLRVGHGHDIQDDNKIDIPEGMVCANPQSLIDFVYPDIHEYFLDRTILAARNADVDDINEVILEHMAGNTVDYFSADSIDNDDGSQLEHGDEFNGYQFACTIDASIAAMRPEAKIDLADFSEEERKEYQVVGDIAWCKEKLEPVGNGESLQVYRPPYIYAGGIVKNSTKTQNQSTSNSASFDLECNQWVDAFRDHDNLSKISVHVLISKNARCSDPNKMCPTNETWVSILTARLTKFFMDEETGPPEENNSKKRKFKYDFIADPQGGPAQPGPRKLGRFNKENIRSLPTQRGGSMSSVAGSDYAPSTPTPTRSVARPNGDDLEHADLPNFAQSFISSRLSTPSLGLNTNWF